jgi:hypothetical protein
LPNFFYNMSMNGQPLPSELAKGAVPSDGIGPHDHRGFEPHEDGEPSFSDEQVAFLEQRGLHVDRHRGQVLHADGSEVPPSTVGVMLNEAREQGLLKVVTLANDTTTFRLNTQPSGTPSVTGPGESAPVVQRLDLRQKV